MEHSNVKKNTQNFYMLNGCVKHTQNIRFSDHLNPIFDGLHFWHFKVFLFFPQNSLPLHAIINLVTYKQFYVELDSCTVLKLCYVMVIVNGNIYRTAKLHRTDIFNFCVRIVYSVVYSILYCQ